MELIMNWKNYPNMVWFCIKAFIHFIYMFITSLIGCKHTFCLNFVKEGDDWFVDFPGWPFNHDNLEMVSGADDICEYLDKDLDGKVTFNVITSSYKLDKPNYIQAVREWAYLRWGGQYQIVQSDTDVENIPIKDFWLCQVTLFVVGWWPKYIYIK